MSPLAAAAAAAAAGLSVLHHNKGWVTIYNNFEVPYCTSLVPFRTAEWVPETLKGNTSGHGLQDNTVLHYLKIHQYIERLHVRAKCIIYAGARQGSRSICFSRSSFACIHK